MDATTMTTTQRQDEIIAIFVSELDSQRDQVATGVLLEALSPKVERTTVFRDLEQLTKLGLLQPEGATKSRTYRLNKSSDAYLKWDLTRPPERRDLVKYDQSLFADYIPNQTEWMSGADEMRELFTIQSGQQNEGDYRIVLNALLIDLTYASSHLENVNISWLDTKSLIEFGERPKGLTEAEMAIVLNHKVAIKFMCEQRSELDINKRDVCDLHKLLMSDLLGNPDDAGRLRQGVILFDGSRYKPIDNPFVLNEQFNIFCEKAQEIQNPFEKSLFSMLSIPYLQPFQDGNKRTSRLCMNVPLLREGLAPFSFTTVSKRNYMFALLAFYERGRTEPMAKVFKEAYAKSHEKYSEILRHLGDGGALSTLDASKLRPRGG